MKRLPKRIPIEAARVKRRREMRERQARERMASAALIVRNRERRECQMAYEAALSAAFEGRCAGYLAEAEAIPARASWREWLAWLVIAVCFVCAIAHFAGGF